MNHCTMNHVHMRFGKRIRPYYCRGNIRMIGFFHVTMLLLLPSVVTAFTTSLHSSALVRQGRRQTQNLRALQFIADAEKEETNRFYKDNHGEDSFSTSWVPTKDGGFLPRFCGKRGANTVHQISTLSEYKRVVADETEKIVCVRFYAPWCRACKAIGTYFKQLPLLYPDVTFVEVPLTKDTAVLHQGLGIPSLPFGHIYHPQAGLVEEQRISRRHFKNFRDKILQSYVDGLCNVEYSDDGAHNFHT